jgi:hypothetical protein
MVSYCFQVSILSSTGDIHDASAHNLSHALNYALLCLPEKFTEHDLYMVLTNLTREAALAML